MASCEGTPGPASPPTATRVPSALCLVDDDTWPVVRAAAQGLADLDRIDWYTDFLAMPSDVCVLTFSAIGHEGWRGVVDMLMSSILLNWQFVVIGVPAS